jgi:hypothetical protein
MSRRRQRPLALSIARRDCRNCRPRLALSRTQTASILVGKEVDDLTASVTILHRPPEFHSEQVAVQAIEDGLEPLVEQGERSQLLGEDVVGPD